MKFELTNSRIKISDIDIINDLRSVANRLGKKSLFMKDYCAENGAKFHIQTATSRFGNWKQVLKTAGLETEKTSHGTEYGEKVSEEELIEDIIKVAKQNKTNHLKARDYDKYGKFSSATILKRFGKWNSAIKKAGLESTAEVDITIENLHENILQLWTHFGRQPKYGEVVKPTSKYSISTYERRFGTWGDALKAFIKYANSDRSSDEIGETESQLIPINTSSIKLAAPPKEVKRKKTPRSINLRLRWTILKRDNFSCTKCGGSPAKNPSIILHVDHIIPWSKGGETVIDNLETLCEQCNLGKSNLL